MHEHPHSDAAKIFNLVQDKITTTSIQAIYNNLKALVESGVIREIKPLGQLSLYETRTKDNHHHIVCRKCQSVMDAECLGCAPCLKPVDDLGFTIDEAEVVFWGICPNCQKSLNKKRRN